MDLDGDLKRRRAAVEVATSVVGQDDGGDLVLDGQPGVLDGLDALEDEGQRGHVAELVQHLPGVGDEGGVGAAHAVASGALPARAAGGVDGPDQGLGAGLLGAVEKDLVGSVVVVGVDLAEQDLVRCALGRDLLDRERREGRRDVQDLAGAGTLDQVELSVGVGISGARTGADEEGCREVVPKDCGTTSGRAGVSFMHPLFFCLLSLA